MVILPSSFLMSPRSQMQRFQDAMATVRKIGYPSLFITFTCNPKWPEIIENIPPEDDSTNHPLLVCRVFQMKLKELLAELVEQHIMGRCIAYLCVIEFQKRGLPHAHILLTLANEDRPTNDVERIDLLVSAEIPHPQREERLYELVGRHMIHGPCGPDFNPRSVCMVDNKCTKNFPKYWYNNTTIRNGRVNCRRRHDDRKFHVNQYNVHYEIDNSFVVPYNPYLLMRYQTHINVKICANIRSAKYLYKYFFKSQDRIVISVVQRQQRQNADEDGGQNEEGRLDYDEIRSYLNGRYMTPPEASWHILQFDMHKNSHHVERLQIHLPGRHQVIFRNGQEQQAANAEVRTQLTRWFEINRNDDFARTILYTEFPQHFVWNKNIKHWTRRQRGADEVISRLVNVSLRNGGLYYLRLLPLHVRGVTSFDDLKTVEGIVCDTFQEACSRRNLLSEDREWEGSLAEAVVTDMPRLLRQMFAYILVFGTVDQPPRLWQLFQHAFIEDFDRQGRPHEEAVNAALKEIQFILMVNGRRLSHFNLPEPPDFRFRETDDDINVDQEREQGDAMLRDLNDNQEQRLFYITGHASTGKTFLYNTLIAYLKGRQIECLPVACTGLAGSLLRYGKTVHSTFLLPVPLMEDSGYKIPGQSEKAQQIRNAKLLIWDEVSMATSLSFDVVDRILRFLCNDQRPFGNKCVVVWGDFKQCLPVVPNGNRAMVINACVKSNHELWQRFERLQLNQNMRVQPDEREFVDWLNELGNDRLPTYPVGNPRNNNVVIRVPAEWVVDSLDDLIQKVFGDLQPGDAPNKAILTPLNDDCDRINEKILLTFANVGTRVYESVDSVVTDDLAEQDLYPLEFLNTLHPSDFPPHQLTLKEEVVVMLLKNLNVRENLCNGTRLVIRNMGQHHLKTDVIGFDGHVIRDEPIFIPRLDFLSTGSNLPFVLKRRQFPERVCYTITINKAQGQSFDAVGIRLPNPVSDHGQLYVAFSRARTKRSVFIHIRDTSQQSRLFDEHDIDDEDDNIDLNRIRYTKNIVYNEVLDEQ